LNLAINVIAACLPVLLNPAIMKEQDKIFLDMVGKVITLMRNEKTAWGPIAVIENTLTGISSEYDLAVKHLEASEGSSDKGLTDKPGGVFEVKNGHPADLSLNGHLVTRAGEDGDVRLNTMVSELRHALDMLDDMVDCLVRDKHFRRRYHILRKMANPGRRTTREEEAVK
jgi:hypothetical protein